MSKDDDDMPPELEDIPDQMLTKKPTQITGQGADQQKLIGDFAQVREDPEETKVEVVVEKPKAEKADGGGFSGFKKGFLSSQPEPKKAKPVEKKDDIVTLTAPKTKTDSKVMPEVQQAMKLNESLLEKKDQWLTPDLLKRITENPNLAKLFTNPEYMQAFTMMQTKPKEVMERYKNNKEFVDLITQFSSTMGEHFTQLGKQEQQNPTPESQVLEDKEVQDILNDKKVKKFLEFLQANQRADFHQVMNSDPDLAKKIKVLIDKKLIQLQKY